MPFKISVMEALQKHSFQAVATAIEEKGCWGNDKYLRIKNNEEVKTNVLELLAEYCKETTKFCDYLDEKDKGEGISFDYSKLEFVDRFDRELQKFGWIDGYVPDFSDSKPNEMVLIQNEFDHPRRINTLLKIIAALLDYSDLKIGETNTIQLIENLTTEIGVRVGEDTVRDVLLEVKQMLEKPTKSTKKT